MKRSFTRFFALSLCFSILFNSLCFGVSAYDTNEAVSDVDYTYVGSIVEIYTAEGLKWFSDEVSAGETFADHTIYLMDDIIFVDDTNNFFPIGDDNNRFAGTFDGLGNTISGINISNSSVYSGLFGYVSSTGIVRNVGLTSTVLSSSANVSFIGGIAGNNDGQIINCFVSDISVDSGFYVGGIVGYNNGTITNSFSLNVADNSSSFKFYGTLVGYNAGSLVSCFCPIGEDIKSIGDGVYYGVEISLIDDDLATFVADLNEWVNNTGDSTYYLWSSADGSVALGARYEVSIYCNSIFTICFRDNNGVSEYAINYSEYTTDYTPYYGNINIYGGETAVIAGPKILVYSGTHYITINYLETDRSTSDDCAFDIQSGEVILNVVGACSFKSANEYAGINVGEYATLTIVGSGSLTAVGQSSAAGIGSNYYSPCGEIIISLDEGGSVSATGSTGATGIGAGAYCTSEDVKITINSGTVTSVGGTNAAGIGGSSQYTGHVYITINGGDVTAYGGKYSAAIGGGNSNSESADITINGGNVVAVGASNGVGIGSGGSGQDPNLFISSAADVMAISTNTDRSAIEANISSSTTAYILMINYVDADGNVYVKGSTEVYYENGELYSDDLPLSPTEYYSSIAMTVPNAEDYTVYLSDTQQAHGSNDEDFTVSSTGLTAYNASKLLYVVDNFDLTDNFTAAVKNGTPSTTFITDEQYSGKVSWTNDDGSPVGEKFLGGETYKAIVVLEAATDYTFIDVPENSFYYTGSDLATNDEGVSSIMSVIVEFTTEAPVLTGIEITQNPDKTDYTYPDKFDPTGMEVTATYDDGTTADVTDEVSYPDTPLDAGTESVPVTLDGKTADVPVTVTPFDLENADVTDFEPMTYDGTEQTPEATVTVGGVEIPGTWSDVTNVGDETAFTPDEPSNFTGTLEKDPLMAKADYPAIEFADTVLAYTGEDQTLKATLPVGADGISPTAVYAGDDGIYVKNIGDTATITATFSTESDNYNTPEPMTATISVASRVIDIVVDDVTITLNDAIPEFTYTIENDGLADGHSISYIEFTCEVADSSDAGTYEISASNVTIIDANGDDVTADYGINYRSATLTVEKMAVELTLSEDSFDYDGETHKPDVTADPDIDFDVIIKDEDGNIVDEPTEIGTYYVYADIDDDANYEQDDVPSFEIVAADTGSGDGDNSGGGTTGGGTVVVPDSSTDDDADDNTDDSDDDDTSKPSDSYSDVTDDDWFSDGVDFVGSLGLMNGTGNGEFSPYLTTTRGMIATILHRMDGAGLVDFDITFLDLVEDAYYVEGIRWAQLTGVVLGYSDTAYGPDDYITREQMAAMLWRFTSYMGYDESLANTTTITSFADYADVTAYAFPALEWAVANGIMQGKSDNMLDPTGLASRAEVAVMLMRYYEHIGETIDWNTLL